MKYFLPIIALLLLLNYSCKPTDDFDTSSDIELGFSLDTLRFDTVFTELGSATRILKVYNPKKKDIQISRISIKNDPGSFFRINVDGIAGNVATDVEIAGNDSLYIFAEVTIDPDNPLSISPFVIEDYLVFEINGNTQELLMEAWGQNANYVPSRFGAGETRGFNCDSLTPGALDDFFDDPKPYVFYGTFVFQNCDITIPAGTQIYVHGGIAAQVDAQNMRTFINDGRLIFVNSDLNVLGEQGNPVVFQGDRLEESFQDIPGQWWGVYILYDPQVSPQQGTHHIQHAEIKNSIFGVIVDSTNLNLESTKIYNTSNAGLVGLSGNVDATNCLFYNNGANNVRILKGGDYNFTYCTLASYGVESSALSMSNVLCFDPLTCDPCIEHPLDAKFFNSIIFGSKRDEISLEDFDGCDPGKSSPLNYEFRKCIVRVDQLLEQEDFENFFSSQDNCDPCQNADNTDAIFFDPNADDYRLDTLSIAEMWGDNDFGKFPPLSPNVGDQVMFDIDGNERDSNSPDVGCYEYQY
ncbi:MAG: hypothetical protein AAF573_04205 [Bacteroidota bacterium]